MRTLIGASELETREHLSGFASRYGICDNASNPSDALRLFSSAIEDGGPYDAVFLDTSCSTPNTLRLMRELEQASSHPEDSNALIFGTGDEACEPHQFETLTLPLTEESFKEITKQISASIRQYSK